MTIIHRVVMAILAIVFVATCVSLTYAGGPTDVTQWKPFDNYTGAKAETKDCTGWSAFNAQVAMGNYSGVIQIGMSFDGGTTYTVFQGYSTGDGTSRYEILLDSECPTHVKIESIDGDNTGDGVTVDVTYREND